MYADWVALEFFADDLQVHAAMRITDAPLIYAEMLRQGRLRGLSQLQLGKPAGTAFLPRTILWVQNFKNIHIKRSMNQCTSLCIRHPITLQFRCTFFWSSMQTSRTCCVKTTLFHPFPIDFGSKPKGLYRDSPHESNFYAKILGIHIGVASEWVEDVSFWVPDLLTSERRHQPAP